MTPASASTARRVSNFLHISFLAFSCPSVVPSSTSFSLHGEGRPGNGVYLHKGHLYSFLLSWYIPSWLVGESNKKIIPQMASIAIVEAGSQELLLGPPREYREPRTWDILCCFPRPPAGTWIKSGAVWTRAGTYIGSECHNWRLGLLCRGTSPEWNFWKLLNESLYCYIYLHLFSRRCNRTLLGLMCLHGAICVCVCRWWLILCDKRIFVALNIIIWAQIILYALFHLILSATLLSPFDKCRNRCKKV